MDKQIEVLFKKYLKPTRGSHFVKRGYLSLWSKDGKHILTCRDGKNFISNNLSDVCTERDMYKMEKLTNLEVEQVKTFYRNSPDCVKKANDGFIKMWQLTCDLLENINNPEYKEIAKNMAIQCGEDLQSSFESTLDSKTKDYLLKCDETFLYDDNNLLDFGLYLFSQYLRTQKQKNKITNNLQSTPYFDKFEQQLNPKRIWKVLITIMSNMAAYTLLTRSKNNHICFIKSKDNLLLTSDQPIVNIAENIDRDYVKFYYPISPSVAIIFPTEESSTIEDDEKIIGKLNDIIIKNRFRMIFKY